MALIQKFLQLFASRINKTTIFSTVLTRENFTIFSRLKHLQASLERLLKSLFFTVLYGRFSSEALPYYKLHEFLEMSQKLTLFWRQIESIQLHTYIYNYIQFRRYKPQYFLALGSKLSSILNIWSKEDITGIITNRTHSFREKQMESTLETLKKILYLMEYGESILTQLKNRLKKSENIANQY